MKTGDIIIHKYLFGTKLKYFLDKTTPRMLKQPHEHESLNDNEPSHSGLKQKQMWCIWRRIKKRWFRKFFSVEDSSDEDQ